MAEEASEASDKKPDRDPHTICGWCGKSKDEVKVVAGPITNICDSCCRLAAGILQILPPDLAFDKMPDPADTLDGMKPDWTHLPSTDTGEMYIWLTSIASTYEEAARRQEKEASMLRRVAAVVYKSRPPLPEHLKCPSDPDKKDPGAPSEDKRKDPAPRK